ncbi:PqqD family protein [Pedobacter arcticus]|uniref:PqqD family protein n=1 Tax=Pedobacter arcticus TaxID=752140 RepID=UPI0002F4A1E9|nr:PqqD family protein [Pedobacter arcticus]
MSFLSKKIIPSENAVVQEMGEDIVILNLKTEHFYELKEVGKRIWELLSENHSYTLTFEAIKGEYEVSSEQLHTDMERIINGLIKAELIKIN